MTTAAKETPLTVALVNSVTLESEVLSSSHCSAGRPAAALNIYSIAQLMDSYCRKGFVNALNHSRSFECVTACNGHRISICLYSTGQASDGWSHLLVLRDTQGGISPA